MPSRPESCSTRHGVNRGIRAVIGRVHAFRTICSIVSSAFPSLAYKNSQVVLFHDEFASIISGQRVEIARFSAGLRRVTPQKEVLAMRPRSWLAAVAIMPLVASALAWAGQAAQASSASTAARTATGTTGPGLGGGRTGLAAGNPFCKRLGVKYQASSGAQMFCFGAQKVGTVQPGAVRRGGRRSAQCQRGELPRGRQPGWGAWLRAVRDLDRSIGPVCCRGLERLDRLLLQVRQYAFQGGGHRDRLLGQWWQDLHRPGRPAESWLQGEVVRRRSERRSVPGRRPYVLLRLQPVPPVQRARPNPHRVRRHAR